MALQKTITLENGLVVNDAYNVILEEYTDRITKIGAFTVYSFKDRSVREKVNIYTPLSSLAVRIKSYEIRDNGHDASNLIYKFPLTAGLIVIVKDIELNEKLIQISHDEQETINDFVDRLNNLHQDIVVTTADNAILLEAVGGYAEGKGAVLSVEVSNNMGHIVQQPRDTKASDYDIFIDPPSLDPDGHNPTKTRYEWLKLNEPEFADALDV